MVWMEVRNPRGRAPQVGAIDAGIEGELDTGDGKRNLSPQLADRPSPTNSASLFTPNPCHNHQSAAFEQAMARRSATYLFMLALGAAQLVNILWTKLEMPGRSHSPSANPRTGDVCPADILTGKEV